MTFIHAGAASSAITRALVRVCPNCKKKQTTKLSELKQAVSCKHCGTAIPPKS